MKAKVILFSLAFIAILGFVSAQNNKTVAAKSEIKKECYVDSNKNNICDKHEDKTCTVGNGKGLKDGSGKGKCRRNGSCKTKGANYVDTNKNGTCDNNEVTN